MTDSISIDTDAAARSVADWAEYGDHVEAHGRRHHMTLDELRAAVGDTYAPYVQAKQDEMTAREAAYGRVAAHARGVAARLNNTMQTFESTDDENKARIDAVLDA
jgi:hypothetical protein